MGKVPTFHCLTEILSVNSGFCGWYMKMKPVELKIITFSLPTKR